MSTENYRYHGRRQDYLVSVGVDDQWRIGEALVAEVSVIVVAQSDEHDHTEAVFRVSSRGTARFFRASGPDANPLDDTVEVVRSIMLSDVLDIDEPWHDENLEAL